MGKTFNAPEDLVHQIQKDLQEASFLIQKILSS
jgi:hypothetical protein